MNWMNFTIVETQVDQQNKTVNIQRVEGVPINIDHVFMVVPTMIPSNVAGPQGQTIGTIASRLISSGGAAVVVEGTPKKVIARIKGERFGEFDQSENIKPDNGNKDTGNESGPNIIKMPDRFEKLANETPSEN